jgi:hypothetical protein
MVSGQKQLPIHSLTYLGNLPEMREIGNTFYGKGWDVLLRKSKDKVYQLDVCIFRQVDVMTGEPIELGFPPVKSNTYKEVI